MFIIKVNNAVIKETNNPNVAWALYRATARDYANKSAQITIEQNGEILHQKNADCLLLDDIEYKTANDVLKATMQCLNIDIKQLKILLLDSELQLSNSRIDGWIRPVDDRKFVKLHNDELIVIIEILLNYQKDNSTHFELGYTANNLKSMRKQLNLTQQQLAEILDVKAGGRQIRRWENSEQDMPTEKWKNFLDYFKNNSKNTLHGT